MGINTILVSRTDKAGDLILTLPVFSALRKALPQARILAHVRSYTMPLVQGRDDVNEIILDDPGEKVLPLLSLAKVFQKKNIDAAIIVHPSWRAILGCRLARIPIRIGRASNIWQIFLTERMVQHRSKNEMHEYQYNLDLLSELGITAQDIPPRVILSKSEIEMGRSVLDSAGLKGKSPVIVHPGHGGSAYNLSLSGYEKLVSELLSKGFSAGITIGPGEKGIKAGFQKISSSSLFFLTNLPDLRALAQVLHHSMCFIGGSTGPLHLAAALGVPCVALFPPQKSMTPVRWGPLGNRSRFIMPSVNSCPGKCELCDENPCMEKIDFSKVLETFEEIRRDVSTL